MNARGVNEKSIQSEMHMLIDWRFGKEIATALPQRNADHWVVAPAEFFQIDFDLTFDERKREWAERKKK